MKTTTLVAMAFLGMLSSFTITAQNNVGIGTTNPDASAVLELESTTQGFLPPRMLEAERDGITTPAAGLIVWCTDCGTDGETQVYNGTDWTNMVGGAALAGPTPPTVQQRLNLGETPISIFNSLVVGGATSSNALDSLYGKTYQGGLIAALNTSDGTGLIAAASDQSTGMQWTLTAYHYTLIGASAQSTTLGNANTVSIVGQAGVPASGVNYAAYLCDALTLGGYTDWYLPSKDELYLLYKNLHRYGCSAAVPGGTDNTPCATSVGGFANVGYWSSSESGSGNYARGQDFPNGFQGLDYKSATYYVRAVRAF